MMGQRGTMLPAKLDRDLEMVKRGEGVRVAQAEVTGKP